MGTVVPPAVRLRCRVPGAENELLLRPDLPNSRFSLRFLGEQFYLRTETVRVVDTRLYFMPVRFDADASGQFVEYVRLAATESYHVVGDPSVAHKLPPLQVDDLVKVAAMTDRKRYEVTCEIMPWCLCGRSAYLPVHTNAGADGWRWQG